MTTKSTVGPKRPEVLALWGRALMPADVVSGSEERRERLVRVVSHAMVRPVRGGRAWNTGFRGTAVASAAACLMLLAVGAGLARTAGRWKVMRFELGHDPPVEARIAPSAGPREAGLRPSPPGAPSSTAKCVSSAPAGPVEMPIAADVHVAATHSPFAPKPLLDPSPPALAPSSPSAAPADVPAPAIAQTDLADQNRLFAEAMSARKRGGSADALDALEQFVRSYPHSPLAQDAYVERFRILSEAGDRAAAARAARAYLTLFPRGFAREEADSLASD